VEQVSPGLVEFNDAVDVVVWKAAFGVVGTDGIGVLSKHRYVQHVHHHEMLKLKISLPRKKKPPTR
jgi:hypothetical protein